MGNWGTSPDDFSRYANFNIISEKYKTVHGHSISTSVLYPKALVEGKPAAVKPAVCPILIHFHGGGLVVGSSLFPAFFPLWSLDLAHRHSAIIVSPDYRLVPEASIQDILDDVEDLWVWVQTVLSTVMERETGGAVKADLGRVMTGGSSAGGYLSIMLGLSHPDQIRAVTAAYPALDVGSDHFTGEYTKTVFSVPLTEKNLLANHMKKVRETEALTGKKVVVSSDPKVDREDLMWTLVQHRLYRPFYPPEQRGLFPYFRLEDGERFPRGGLVVWHGSKDSVVPVEGSYKLQSMLAELDPQLKFRLVIRDGEHVFDAAARLDEEWVTEALGDVVNSWLE